MRSFSGIHYIAVPPTKGSFTTYNQDNIVVVKNGEPISLAQAVAETHATINAILTQTWIIADRYSVTNEPLDWFAVDAAIDVAAESEDDLVAMRAIRDGVTLNKNSMFLKEWGVDLFDVHRTVAED